ALPIYVMDAYGCIKTTDVLVLPQDPSPVIDAVVTNACDTTEGNFEIEVSLTTAGMLPYFVSIDGGAFQAQTTFPFTIQNVTSGPHTVEVRDLNGCGNMVNLNIELPLEITPLVTQIDRK